MAIAHLATEYVFSDFLLKEPTEPKFKGLRLELAVDKMVTCIAVGLPLLLISLAFAQEISIGKPRPGRRGVAAPVWPGELRFYGSQARAWARPAVMVVSVRKDSGPGFMVQSVLCPGVCFIGTLVYSACIPTPQCFCSLCPTDRIVAYSLCSTLRMGTLPPDLPKIAVSPFFTPVSYVLVQPLKILRQRSS